MSAPVLIVGTGALATLFAARLAAAGADVTLLGTWQNGLEALNREGARLLDENGQVRAYPVRATADPAACRGAQAALVLVKSWQTSRAAAQLAQCLAPNGLAVTLQNGMGNKEILAESLGPRRVSLGVTTMGATLLGPGLARLGGEGVLSLEAHPALEGLADVLTAAHFKVDILQDARALAWGKLVINAAINPLTAILGVPNGALLERPAARLLMNRLARETACAARANGVDLPFPDPARAAEDVARRTAQNRSSMFQDVKRGAPTEIDAISGAVVRAARAHRQRAPLNWAMWQMVRAMRAPETARLNG